jgi:hypothetical protein
MIYVSIDIETSGLEYKKHNVLSIGAIIEDTEKKLPFDECPKFNALVVQREIVGSPTALTMNSNIISLMSDYIETDNEGRIKLQELENNKPYGYEFHDQDNVVKAFYWFLYQNGFIDNDNFTKDGHSILKNGKLLPVINGNTKSITINVAGKNFGVFDKLFLQELPWWTKLIRVRQRILDPAILMVNWNSDKSLPPLSVCKERAGLNNHVTHNALEDAWDVIEILRKTY